MNAIDLLTNLGPVAGTVVVVLLFTRFATTYMRSERAHREKLSSECHSIQSKSLEVMGRTEKTLEQVNRTLIRMNGGP